MSTLVSSSAEIPFVDLQAQYALLKDEILAAIASVLDSMQLFQGPQQRAFEEEFARFCGCQHAFGVSNGTDALELALRALNIGSGDEVITQPNTFVATAEAISAVGARVPGAARSRWRSDGPTNACRCRCTPSSAPARSSASPQQYRNSRR